MIRFALIVASTLGFVLTAALGNLMTPLLRAFRVQQEENEPPTMGGLCLMVGTLAAVGVGWTAACVAQPELLGTESLLTTRLLIALFGALCFGAVGLADDVVRLRHRSPLGLRRPVRLALEAASGTLVLALLGLNHCLPDGLALPGVGYCTLGPLAPVVWLAILVALAESARTADGMDGTVCGCAFIALLGLGMFYSAPSPYSFIPAQSVFGTALAAICWFFLGVSAMALLVKWAYWNNYSSTIMKRPLIVRVSRYLSYLDAAACALLVLDRFILKLAYIINAAIHADSNPTDTLSMMAYMAYNQRSLFAIGISYTVRLALFGTAIAFVLALLMVFLRIQEPDKRDNDFVKFLKIVANKFSRFYIFVIRGTPMMVQSLILYNAVFGLFKRTGMSVSDINRVWPLFLAGLVTISLNSTAYLAEVLRGGILAVDAGQMEAARSLGMTHWQAMRKVVFPQAIKNSLPAIGNEFIINIKDSSVLCVVGVSDLMFMTRSVAGIYYKGTECYLIAAIVYLFLTYLSSLLLKAITGKMTAPDNTKRHQGNQTVDLGLPSSN